MRKHHLAFSVLVILFPGSLYAQASPGELTLFSNQGLTGAQFVVTGPREFLDVPYEVRSAAMDEGQYWELCRQVQYRDCITVSGAQRSLRLFVRSARPTPQIRPPIGNIPVPGQVESLRGTGSEFFPKPRQHNERIRVQPAVSVTAKLLADRFCRLRGYGRAAYHFMETVGRRAYLADVLCITGKPAAAGGAYDGLQGIAGMNSINAFDVMISRGFKNVDSFKSGNTQYGIFYNSSTRMCAQLTMAGGKVLDARDIRTHPKCR